MMAIRSGVLALDITAARTGGGVSRARELAGTLAELAPQISYVFAVSRPVADRLPNLPPRTSLLLVPAGLERTPLRLAWEHLMLPSKLAKHGPSWILAPFNVLPLGATRGRSPRRALIVSNIGPFAKEILATSSGYQRVRNSLLRRLTIQSLRKADVVFLLSREAGELLRPWLAGKSVHVLPMAPPGPPALKEAASASIPAGLSEAPYFLIAGDLLPYKGVEDALFAMRRLSKRGREARLIVVGTPIDPAYAKRLAAIARNGAEPHSIFAGPLPQPQVLALMGRALATVLCSRVENTSRIPVEAMAVGSPVLIADRPYARDSCHDAALYYPAGNSEALADHMEVLIDQPKARDQLVDRGARLTAEVDWLAATRKILQTLELL